LTKPHAYNYYLLASHLRPLNELKPGQKLSGDITTIQILTYVKIGLLLFLIPENAKHFPSSYAKAELMSNYLDEQLIKLPNRGKWDDVLEEPKLKGIQSMLKSFETLLGDELARAPLFLCDEEILGNLSIDKLLVGAQNGYPSKYRVHLPMTCTAEIEEAGKCLAFERATAAGFHILRSVEIMVKHYLALIPGFVMPPLNRQNWGEYIKLLKANNASVAVSDTLESIRKNHRNPLMHPEDTLDIHEAVGLFGICQSMTESLVEDLLSKKLVNP
jgi:hypothetical protein